MKVQGSGSVEKRGDHRWLIRVCYTDDNGKTFRPSQTVAGTKQEAREKLAAWIRELNLSDAEKRAIEKREQEEKRAHMTFGEYALEWHRTRGEVHAVRPSTYDREARSIRTLCAYLGATAFCDLDALTVKAAYASMRADGVSQSNVHKDHVQLRQILQAAFDDDLIMCNPCDKKSVKEAAKRPTPAKRVPLTACEAARLDSVLDAIGDADPKAIGVRLALHSGMRLGEVLGLDWGNVDLIGSRVHVVQQFTPYGVSEPKTHSSTRWINIDAETTEHLKAWKKAQAAYLARLDPRGKQRLETPVVIDALGEHMDQSNYQHWFHNFCVLNGYGRWLDDNGEPVEPTRHNPDGSRVGGNGRDASGRPYSRNNPKATVRKHYSGLKFHELRHTHFTLQTADGVDIKTIQARGGWSSPMIPLAVYAHAVEDNDRKAAATFAATLRSSKPGVLKVVESKAG